MPQDGDAAGSALQASQSDADSVRGESTSETITFEKLPYGSYDGTERLAFSGLDVLTRGSLNGKAVAWNADRTVEIDSKTEQSFDFESAVFGAGFRGATILVEGWNGDQLVASLTLELGSRERLDSVFGDEFHGIDRLVIHSDQAIIVDDLAFVTYAEPSPEPTNTEAVFGPGGLTASVIEDIAPNADSAVTVVDPDPSEAGVVAQSGIRGDYGTFSITQNGEWTYTLGAAADALAGGETRTDRFAVTSLDGSATQTVTVTVTGTDDPATFLRELGITTGNVVEDTTTTASGRLVVEDPDAGEAGVVANGSLSLAAASFQTASDANLPKAGSGAEGTYGTFSITQDGQWSYTLGVAADALAEGEMRTETFTVSSLDGSATETVTVTVTGTDDPAAFLKELGSATGNVVEDATTTATGRLVVEDPDAGEAKIAAQSGTAGDYGTFSITEDGAWTYTLNAAADALAKGETRTESFTVNSFDGSATETVTVTVTGADEPLKSQSPPPESAIDVANAAELMAALRNAEGGETIRLAPGDYGKLVLNAEYNEKWAIYEVPVTITSLDSNDMASFSGVMVHAAQGLTFDTIRFEGDDPQAAVWSTPFKFERGTEDITIRNSIFEGMLASGVDEVADGHGTAIGLTVHDASRFTLENNEFFNWMRGATFGENDDLRVVGNEVHSIRSDGFNFSGTQKALIADNYFHDFDGAEGSGDHRDMIQFWTQSTDRPSTDIVIRDNRLMSGEGDWTQSIFIRNEEVDTGRAGEEMFYRNILIENNLIWNAHTHGITVGETDGLTIRNNTVLHNKAAGGEDSVYVPQIIATGPSKNVTITGNITSAVTAQPGAVVENNLLVQRDFMTVPNHYKDLFVNALNDGFASIEDLQALPGGIIEQNGYGAEITRYDPAPETLTAVARKAEVEGETSLYTFDGSFSAGPEGRLDAGEARYLWDFGDGVTAEGITAVHQYTTPDVYTVTLEVVAADGTRDSTSSRLEVINPLLLDIDVENSNVVDTSSYQADVNGGKAGFASGRDGEQAIAIGKDKGFEIDKKEIDQIYDLETFSLSFGFRATNPGEVLRIHTALEIDLTSGGQIAVSLTNADEKTFTISSPRGLIDGDWHDVTVTFDGVEGLMQLYVDGTQYDLTGVSGRTQPMESWGLSVGGATSWVNGFTGAIDHLEFRSDVLEAPDIAEQHGALSSDGLAPPILHLDDFEVAERADSIMLSEGGFAFAQETMDEAWL